MEKNAVGIRTDANEEIGMGHLMRCMAIACQLKKLGKRVIFLLSEKAAEAYVRKSGFFCLHLSHSYREKEAELPELTGILLENRITCLLVDSYEITFFYMQELKKVCRTVYLDDLGHFEYPVHLFIHYTYGMERMAAAGNPEQPWKTTEETEDGRHKKGYEKHMFGIRFVPLREEFSGPGVTIKDTVENIYITTGGTDPYHMIVSILEGLSFLRNIRKHVVVGRFYQDLEILRKTKDADPSVRIYQDIPDVCRIMKSCDLAVSAGGTTLMELCACGVPSIAFVMAENQTCGVKAFAKEGIIDYAGDVRKNPFAVTEKIRKEIVKLKDDFILRKTYGEKGKAVIDGKGAERIAKGIAELL